MEKKGLYQTAHTKVCFRNVVSCGRCASTFYYIDCQRSNECCNYNMVNIIFHDRKVTICDFRVYTSFAMKEGYRVDFVRYVEFRVHPGAPNSYVWCWFAYILSPTCTSTYQLAIVLCLLFSRRERMRVALLLPSGH